MILLLTSSFGITSANFAANTSVEQGYTANGDKVLQPDSDISLTNQSSIISYLNRFADYLGKNLSKTELDKIKSQWAQQIRHNQQVIQDTKGAVLNYQPNAQLDSLSGCVLSHVALDHIPPYEPYGYIENPQAMEGNVDYNYAHLHTSGWNEHYDDTAMGGEAFAAGWMQTYYGGDIYVNCKTGPHSGADPPWTNLVMVYGSNDVDTPFLEWTLIGTFEVAFSSPAWYYAGNCAQFSVISIICWTPPPYPDPYSYPDYFNCVEVDAVSATNSYQCLLDASTTEGGILSIDRWTWSDYGTQIQATAWNNQNYAFDYWTLDGDVYTANPITVTMTRSQHFLQAHFTYVGPTYQLTVLARNQYGTAGYVPLYIDGQYVGTTEYTYTVSAGNHQIYVPSQVWSGRLHVFNCFYYDGGYDYSDPTTVSITSDKTVTAYYYTY